MCSCLPWFCAGGSCSMRSAGFEASLKKRVFLLCLICLGLGFIWSSDGHSILKDGHTYLRTETVENSLLMSFCVWLKPEKWKQAEIIDQNGRECFKCQSVCHTKVICLRRTWNIVHELYGPLHVLFEALTVLIHFQPFGGWSHPSCQCWEKPDTGCHKYSDQKSLQKLICYFIP